EACSSVAATRANALAPEYPLPRSRGESIEGSEVSSGSGCPRKPERFLRYPAMKFSALALAFTVVLAGPAVAAPGDPRLIQGVLEWPFALTRGEPFLVVRGDDGRVYYADVMAAQRHVQATVSAGSHIALLGLEGTKPHEIVAVALGSGDAAALSLALAQGT